MRHWLLVLALAGPSAGCTTLALERHTLNQSESAAEIRYREVLNNLALIAANHWALPSYCSVYAGTAKVFDQFQASSGTAVAREMIKPFGTITALDQEALDLQAQRMVTENWSLDPTAAPETLVAMRCANWWVLNGPESLCPECSALLGPPPPDPWKRPGHYYDVAKDLKNIPPGWLGVGSRKDVPKDACYRAQCHGTHVWVTRDGMPGLSAFTLVLLDIATVDYTSLTVPPASATLEVARAENRLKTEVKGRAQLAEDKKTIRVTAPGIPPVDFTAEDLRLTPSLAQLIPSMINPQFRPLMADIWRTVPPQYRSFTERWLQGPVPPPFAEPAVPRPYTPAPQSTQEYYQRR